MIRRCSTRNEQSPSPFNSLSKADRRTYHLPQPTSLLQQCVDHLLV
ncbi:hypothetical protein M3J09_009288 [Ascochyta lentis]